MNTDIEHGHNRGTDTCSSKSGKQGHYVTNSSITKKDAFTWAYKDVFMNPNIQKKNPYHIITYNE